MSVLLALLSALPSFAQEPPAPPRGAPPRHENLRAEWRRYVHAFLQSDGRVIDRADADVSTSEGQAYAMVRALWCDDHETFARVRRWTRDNLQGGDGDALPAWRWGKAPDGSWKVLDPAPAADADTWMAWALLRAGERWKQPAYRAQALRMIRQIWTVEVAEVGGRKVLLPGPWARGTDPVRLNPSYWLPFAWKAFARVDSAHDWSQLATDAYALWDACRSPSGLLPDWCWVDATTGAQVEPPEGEAPRLASGYDAFRVAWTLAADTRWSGDTLARAHLEPWARLADGWHEGRPIPAVHHPDGTAREPWGYLGLYGALLPAWGILRPGRAGEIYAEEVQPVQEGTPDPRAARDYYAHNWVWMGLALWSGLARP
jgi:endo-1,4-beta-D-glucanase Y